MFSPKIPVMGTVKFYERVHLEGFSDSHSNIPHVLTLMMKTDYNNQKHHRHVHVNIICWKSFVLHLYGHVFLLSLYVW